jgi:FG-GAP repeat
VGVLLTAALFVPSAHLAPARASVPPRSNSPVYVDPQFLPDTLTSTSPGSDGRFGQSIAVSGATVAVGAPGESAYTSGYYDYGQVHVYNLTTGSTHLLTAAYNGSIGGFGWSVAMGGGYIVVGAPGEGFGVDSSAQAPGHVFVYNASTFAQVTSYESPNAVAYYSSMDARYFTDDFGESVAVSGNLMVVGAPGENASGQLAAGHAYIINLRNRATVMLASPDPVAAAAFGGAVAINGNYVVVGAPSQGLLTGVGGAYVFSAITGDFIEALTTPAPSIGESFGASVAILWPTVAVGAPYQTANVCPGGYGVGQCGTVYLYNLQTGSVGSLVSPAATSEGEFGSSVALGPTTVLVGAPDEAPNASSYSGAAYLFGRATGQPINSTFGAPEWPAGAVFGTSVAQNSTSVFVGAPGEHAANYASAGHAFVFGKIPLSLGSPNSVADGGFGRAVSVQDGITAIGAPNETVGAMAGAGRVYLERSALGQVTVLNGSEASQSFGAAVAVDPSYLAVGAPGSTAGAGEISVFYTSNATLDYVISPPSGVTGLGTTVAISGNFLISGAPASGFVGIFNLSSRGVEDFITRSGTDFGASVAIAGTTTVIGEPSAGAAFTLPVGGVDLYPLTNPSGGPAGAFGSAVAIGGSTIAVGAPLASGGGEVYVYSNSTRALLFGLTDPNASSGGAFGDALADNGGTLAVGADGQAPYGVVGAGNVFLFGAGSGSVLDRYNSPTPTTNASFGAAVALGNGGQLLVGDDPPFPTQYYYNGGQAYLFFY